MHIVCSVHLLSFLCYWDSEPLDPPEPHERPCRQGGRQQYNQQEGMGEGIQVDVHIHAIEAGDDGGYHQRDAEARHAFHDVVHVVRDDGGEGVHRAGQDVAVDVHRVVGLAQLDDGVVQQLHVQHAGVLEDVLQPAYQHFVAADGGIEVNQRLLQLHQSQQVFVADALLQLFFGVGHFVVDLLQVLQEPDGRGVDEAQDEVQLVVHGDALAARVLDEVGQQLRAVIADGDDDVVVGDDADGHGDEGNLRVAALHGDAQDGQQPVAFGLGAGPFVGVGNVFQEGFGYVKFASQELEIVVVGAFYVYPAVGCPHRLLHEAVFAVEILSHRSEPPFLGCVRRLAMQRVSVRG